MGFLDTLFRRRPLDREVDHLVSLGGYRERLDWQCGRLGIPIDSSTPSKAALFVIFMAGTLRERLKLPALTRESDVREIAGMVFAAHYGIVSQTMKRLTLEQRSTDQAMRDQHRAHLFVVAKILHVPLAEMDTDERMRGLRDFHAVAVEAARAERGDLTRELFDGWNAAFDDDRGIDRLCAAYAKSTAWIADDVMLRSA